MTSIHMTPPTRCHAQGMCTLVQYFARHHASFSLLVAETCIPHVKLFGIQSQKRFFITKLNEVGWKVRNSEQFCDCSET